MEKKDLVYFYLMGKGSPIKGKLVEKNDSIGNWWKIEYGKRLKKTQRVHKTNFYLIKEMK